MHNMSNEIDCHLELLGSETDSVNAKSVDSCKSILEANETYLQWFDRVVTEELEMLKNKVFVNKEAPDFLKNYKDDGPVPQTTSSLKNHTTFFHTVKNFAKAEIINDLYKFDKEKEVNDYDMKLLDFKKESFNNIHNPIEVLSYVGVTKPKKNE